MPNQIFQNDTQALQEMANGNITAYKFLFDHHFSDLCNFLLIYLHSKELSEEIALEMFTYVWEKRNSLIVKTSFKTFLFAIAKNKAITHYRREHKKLFTTLDLGEPMLTELSNAQVFLENDELRKIIEEAIEKLPEKSRQVYQMAWEENLSHKEISIKMGITPKTVENHVGIALRKLRESLNPYYKQIFMLWILQTFWLE